MAMSLILAVVLTALVATLPIYFLTQHNPKVLSGLPKAIPGSRSGYTALRFFTDRKQFVQDALKWSTSGHFSFFLGSRPVVVVSGEEGRNFTLQTKGLDLAQGYATLLSTVPAVTEQSGEENLPTFWEWTHKTIIGLVQTANLQKQLPALLADTDACVSRVLSDSQFSAGVFDPFEEPYRLVYQFTMRAMGIEDIAESPKLLNDSLDLFETIALSTSPLRIVYPALPTPAYLRRLVAGIRLYRMIKTISSKRIKSKARRDDALQFVLDGQKSDQEAVAFICASVFAGNLTNAYIVSWTLVYLASDLSWQERIRKEVKGVVESNRASEDQSSLDVLLSLSLEQWEHSFPSLAACQRETIRLQHVGCFFRLNISGKALPIGKSGEIVPPDAFVAYPLDDIHLDPQVYEDAWKWNPGRYLASRETATDRESRSYVGWGAGRHVCPGMRFAKIQACIIVAWFVLRSDMRLVDEEGALVPEAPLPDRNQPTATKPKQPVRIKYVALPDEQADQEKVRAPTPSVLIPSAA